MNQNGGKVRHITDIIGEFGRWQCMFGAFMLIYSIESAINSIGFTFHSFKVDFWCDDVPIDYQNKTQNMKCFKFSNPNEKCTKWRYDRSGFYETIITEFDLVCDRSYYASLTQSAYMIGYVMGGLILPYFSDKSGRRPVGWLSIILELIATISCAFSYNYLQYLLGRFLCGFAAIGRYATCVIILMESLGPKKRSDVALIPQMGFPIGLALLPLVAFLLKNFRHMLYCNVVMLILLLICYYWFDESPRWQITKGHFDKAEKTIKKAMRINGKPEEGFDEKMKQLKESVLGSTIVADKSSDLANQTQHKTLMDMFKTFNLRKYTFAMCLIFPIMSLIYHGLTYNIGSFGGNYYVSFMLGGLIEIPSSPVCILLMRIMGRKQLAIGLFSLTAIMCLLMAINQPALRVSSALVAKFSTSGLWRILEYIVVESFPTELRNTAFSFSKVSSRVGAVIAPFIKDIAEITSITFIAILYAALSFSAAGLITLFAETKGKELPDTVREAEENSVAKEKKTNNHNNAS